MEIKPQEIKDYLHLYIGCEVKWWNSDQEQWEDMKLGTMMLDHVFRKRSIVKPILRKLSDMTEEEMKEFKKLIPHIDFVRFEPKGNKWVYIEHEQDGKHGTRAVCKTTAMIGSIPMSAMPYLLRQGFDLFGLIPAGLAIDKTSLKN